MSKAKGRAKFDFTGKEELKQLSFKKGDIVTINQQYDNGWWAGELNGKIGYVPATYVELLPDGASSSAPPPSRPPPAGAVRGGVGNAPSNPSPPATRPPPSTNPPSRPPVTAPATAPRGSPTIPAPGSPNRPNASQGVSNPPPVAPKPNNNNTRDLGGSGGVPGGRTAPPVANRTGPPATAPRGAGGSGGGGGGSSGAGVSEADYDELDGLIRKMQSDMNDLKQYM